MSEKYHFTLYRILNYIWACNKWAYIKLSYFQHLWRQKLLPILVADEKSYKNCFLITDRSRTQITISVFLSSITSYHFQLKLFLDVGPGESPNEH